MSVSIYVYQWRCEDHPFKPGYYTFTPTRWTDPITNSIYTYACTVDGHAVFMKNGSRMIFRSYHFTLIDPIFDVTCVSDAKHADLIEMENFVQSFDQYRRVFHILRMHDAREEAEQYIAKNKRAVYRDKVFCLVHLPPLVIAKVFQSLV